MKKFKDKSEWPSEDYAWSSRENDYLDDSKLIWNPDGSGKIVSVTRNQYEFAIGTDDSAITFKSDAFEEGEVSEARAADSRYTSRTEPIDIVRDIQHRVSRIPSNIQHLVRRIPRDIQHLVRRPRNSASKNSGAGKSSRYTRRD